MLHLYATHHTFTRDFRTWQQRFGSTSWQESSDSPTKRCSICVPFWASESRATHPASKMLRLTVLAARPSAMGSSATFNRKRTSPSRRAPRRWRSKRPSPLRVPPNGSSPRPWWRRLPRPRSSVSPRILPQCRCLRRRAWSRSRRQWPPAPWGPFPLRRRLRRSPVFR